MIATNGIRLETVCAVLLLLATTALCESFRRTEDMREAAAVIDRLQGSSSGVPGPADIHNRRWSRSKPARSAELASVRAAAASNFSDMKDALAEYQASSRAALQVSGTTALLLLAAFLAAIGTAFLRRPLPVPARPEEPLPAPQRGVRVLIVDDDAMVRGTLRRFFERLGYEVVMAADGEEAVLRLAETRPDMVLLDIFMPGLDWLGTIRSIRRTDPMIPVAMISGAVNEDLVRHCLDHGACDFIPKPFDFDYLERSVLAQVSGRSIRG